MSNENINFKETPVLARDVSKENEETKHIIIQNG